MHRLGLAGSAALAILLGAAAPARGLSVTQAWMRVLIPPLPAAGYFTVANSGDVATVLTSASSPACGQLMLHRSVDASGIARMDMVPSVTIPAHGTLAFAPGGYHLMCNNPANSVVPGGQVPVTLQFQDGTTLRVDFAVYGPKGR
ncbi:MAG: copper chaperone PCu(A)C [Pseudomonadota bacterium]|nr:copper chaperone PCu(A)C [Pseudomonadota bacterium]